jgi:hypothetical protein
MLKYNIRKRKHWVHPLFCESLNGGAYIVSKELNLEPAWHSVGGVCHIYQGLTLLNAQKQN